MESLPDLAGIHRIADRQGKATALAQMRRTQMNGADLKCVGALSLVVVVDPERLLHTWRERAAYLEQFGAKAGIKPPKVENKEEEKPANPKLRRAA